MHDEIGVNAVLDRRWSAWFDGLEVSSDDRGQTTIVGPVVDQAACTPCWPGFATWVWSCWRWTPPTAADTDTKGPTMQPPIQQTAAGAGVAGLPAGLLALVGVAGSAGLFATYWEDAWHTDLGRDQATIPPHHLLLYASMATIGAVVAAWGLSALWRDRSPAAVWRQPPLLLAAAGGTVTLAGLPVDAAWHARFGGDAVLWSPPHMRAIFGSLVPLVGFLAGARPDVPPWILTSLGALLLALIIRQVRGPARTQPVLHPAGTADAAAHGGGVGHGRAPGRWGP